MAVGQAGGDHQIDQRGGAAEAGPPGPQHPGVAGLDELGGEVDGDVGPGLVVGADDPDRDPALLKLQAVVERPPCHHSLQRCQRGERPHLAGDAGEADLVEPEPVQAACGERVLGALQVLLVGGQDRGGLRGQAGGDVAEGRGDLVVGRPGHVARRPAGLARRLVDEQEDLVVHGRDDSGRIQRLSARLEPSEAPAPSTCSVRVPSGPMPVTSTIAPGISLFSSK